MKKIRQNWWGKISNHFLEELQLCLPEPPKCVSMPSTKFQMVGLSSVDFQPILHEHVHAEHETPCTVGLAAQHGSNDSLDFITLKESERETHTCISVNNINCNTIKVTYIIVCTFSAMCVRNGSGLTTCESCVLVTTLYSCVMAALHVYIIWCGGFSYCILI